MTLQKESAKLRRQIKDLENTEKEYLRQITEMQELEKISQLSIDMVPALLVIKDNNLVYQTANKAFCRRLKKTKNDVIGKTDFQLFSESKASKYRKDDLEVVSFRHMSRTEELVEGATDDWVEVTKIPVFDDADKFKALYTIVRDINERKRAEKALVLENSYKFLQDITANVPCMIIQIKMTQYGFPVFSFVNDGIKNLYELEPEDVIEDANILFQYIHDDDAEKVGRAIQTAYKNTEPWSFDFRIITPRGKLKWINSTAAPQKFADGNLVWNGFSRDITDKKKAEELRKNIDRITKHDLKTPLSSITFLLWYMWEDENLTEKQKKSLLILQRATYKMADLINSSLNLYKIEQGTYVLAKEPAEILPRINNVLIDLYRPIRQKQITVKILVNDKPTFTDNSFIVLGEEALLYSMFANLIKNAVEASPSGGTVSIRFWEKDGQWVEIHNQGVVPKEIRSNFFEKYSTSGKGCGTGIGTYSAKLIAKVHGADIHMKTSEQTGTSIIINFKEKA